MIMSFIQKIGIKVPIADSAPVKIKKALAIRKAAKMSAGVNLKKLGMLRRIDHEHDLKNLIARSTAAETEEKHSAAGAESDQQGKKSGRDNYFTRDNLKK